MLDKTGRKFSLVVISLEIPEEKAVSRILTSKREKRKVDTPEGIHSRLHEFHKGYEERMMFIRKHWPLIIINADRPIEEIEKDILTKLKLTG